MGRRRFGRPGVAKRPTDWVAGSADFSALASVVSGAQAVVSGISAQEGIAHLGTIIRMRGCIHLELANETTVATLQEFGIGIGLVDDRALASSPTAGTGLPQPIDDEDFEGWMWWKCGYLGTTENPQTGTGSHVRRQAGMDIEIDSKAMRKWDENDALVIIVQNRLIDGTATEIDVAMHMRMLLKLP